MTLTIAIIITVVALILYYAGAVAYDMYLDHLSKVNAEEVTETSIDISDEAEGFQTTSVEQEASHKTWKNFENLLSMGLSAFKMNKLMTDASNGVNSPELDNIMMTIKQY